MSPEPQFGTPGYEPLRGVVWPREGGGPLHALCWAPSCGILDWRWLDSGLTVRRGTELYPSTGVDECPDGPDGVPPDPAEWAEGTACSSHPDIASTDWPPRIRETTSSPSSGRARAARTCSLLRCCRRRWSISLRSVSLDCRTGSS